MDREAARRWAFHPATAMVAGLVFYPLARLFYIPAYVLNFLATFVHECGHSLVAWSMGAVSIPTVSIAGGGVAPWYGPFLPLQLAVVGGLGFAAWHYRDRRMKAVLLGVLALVCGAITFSGHHEAAITSGGVLFELGGAAACFVVAVSGDLERPFERPLYALWGWYMLLNRASETWLMLRNPAYYESQRVYESGLAAGLTNDLHSFQDALGWSAKTLTGTVFALCLLVLPAAAAISWWRLSRREEEA